MKKENKNIISIIMPCYNSEHTILDSIYSVLNQNYSYWELIICDDGSTDDSLVKISEINDPRVKLVNNEYIKGAAGARNTALKYATGEYICFLDSDDIWDSSKLNTQLSFMKSTGSEFTYSSYKTFKNNINNIVGEFNPPSEISYHQILKWCDIGCLTVMIRKEILKNINFPYCYKEDYALWLIILKKFNIKARKVPGCISYYRLSPNGLSSNKINEIYRQYNVLVKYSDCGKLEILYNIFLYTLNGIKKHLFFYKSKN